MIFTLLPFGVLADEANDSEPTEKTGTCGVNLTWVLSENGVLTISGRGEMNEYHSFASTPWFRNNLKISSVVIEDGVTSISPNAFGGQYLHCFMLESVVIPDSVKVIGDNAFQKCNKLSDVFYAGSKDDWAKVSGGDSAFADTVRVHKDVAADNVAAHIEKVSVDPTCTKVGYITKSCACDFEYDKEEIEMTEHTYDDDGVCTVCGALKGCNHFLFKSSEVVAPTCTEKGYTIHSCTRCGYDYKDTYTPALGHDYGKDGKCTRCGEMDPDHGHSYTEKKVAATCTSDGYTLYTCACGKSYKDNVVPALGHDIEIKNAKEATINSSGFTGDKVCKVCGETVEKGVPIAQLTHTCPFSDIRNSGYHDWIEEAAAAKIIEGYPDGTYRPNQNVTRAQFITMLYRAVGKPATKAVLSFADNGDIASPYVDAVKWGVENKIVLGYTDNYFRPNQNISRAQMATYLYRYLKDVVHYNFGTVAPVTFADKGQIAAPYVDAVNAIVSMGIMNGMTSTTFDPNGTANRGMAATVMIRGYDKLMAEQAAQNAEKKDAEQKTEEPAVQTEETPAVQTEETPTAQTEETPATQTETPAA